jgi:hypothetical protein
MAHDPDLAFRIRTAIAGRPGVTEKKMFGGIGFLLDGNLLVSASGRGGMLVRVGPDGHASAIAAPHASAMVMGGRNMLGYVRVEPAGVATQGAVASWIERAWKHVRTLAPRTVGQRQRSKKTAVAAASRVATTSRTRGRATRSGSRSRTRRR